MGLIQSLDIDDGLLMNALSPIDEQGKDAVGKHNLTFIVIIFH